MPDGAFSLSGRVALITGGGGGIGAATARFLAAQGAYVVVNDIAAEAAELAVDSIGSSRAVAMVGDVSAVAASRALVEKTAQEIGPIDILVNTVAATTPIANFLDLPPEEWDTSLQSLWSTLACTWAVLPSMVERQYGRIINVTSISGSFGVVGMSIYSASKGAVHAFTAAVAKEVATTGVTVNCVGPGTVDTARQRARDPELRAQRQAAIPIGRFAEPEEVAAAVGFFASDEASYVTGEVLLVDGGRP